MSEQKGQFSVIHEGNPKSSRLSKISILLVMWATDRSLSTLSSCSQQELDEHTLMRFSEASERISISFSTSAKASNNSRSSASTTGFRLNGVFKCAFPERTPEFQKFSFNQRFNAARSCFFFLFLVKKAIKSSWCKMCPEEAHFADWNTWCSEICLLSNESWIKESLPA